MTVSEGLKNEIRIIEAKIKNKNFKLQEVHRQLRDVKSGAEALWRSMNFQERRLWGWFGGDRNKVVRYSGLRKQSEKLEAEVDDLKVRLVVAEGTIEDLLEEFLKESDAVYRKLREPHESARKMKKAVGKFLEKIDSALSEIGDAQSMETLDLFTKSKTISVISYMENAEASEAFARVQRSAKVFQEALEEYSSDLKHCRVAEIKADIGDGLDLAFDLAFDGFDFMSLFTLSRLSDAESSLRQARKKVKEVDRSVSDCLDKSGKALADYLKRARTLCA